PSLSSFQQSSHNPVLHSFPTRRSSDLSSNMDTLVALGSTTAYGYSVWALFTGSVGHLYFMEAAAIITLISIGHWFEARVSKQARSEEHTSELQSRSDLVCRLLLEKKNH